MLIYPDPKKSDFKEFDYAIINANIFLGVSILGACTGAFPGKEDGIRVLAGQALSSQTV